MSARNPDVKEGDILVVRATATESTLGSWAIQYEKVDNAVIGDNTISSEPDSSTENVDTSDLNGASDSAPTSSQNGTSSFVVGNQSSSEKPLEIVDYGWYVNSSSGDTAYVDFCGMIYNPNDNLIAEFPKVLVEVSGSRSGRATSSIVNIVRGLDWVRLAGIFCMLFIKTEAASKSRFCAYAANAARIVSRWLRVETEHFLVCSSQSINPISVS